MITLISLIHIELMTQMGFCVNLSTDLNWRDSADTFESPHQHEYQYKLVRTGTIRRLITVVRDSEQACHKINKSANNDSAGRIHGITKLHYRLDSVRQARMWSSSYAANRLKACHKANICQLSSNLRQTADHLVYLPQSTKD